MSSEKILFESDDETPAPKYTNRSHFEYELTTLNDAFARELMRIHSDLADIKSKLKEPKTEMESFPENFMKMFYIYEAYPYSAICKTYITPTRKVGGIIILLDYCFFDDDIQDQSNYSHQADITLRKLHSEKENKIVSGTHLPVYIYDPEFPDLFHPSMPKVLTIKKDEYCTTIALEIDSNDNDWLAEKFTREIHIYRQSDMFTSDEEMLKIIS